MPEKDPFTKVYETLWAVLEANPAFCALVSPENRIKYVDDISVTPARPARRFPERDSRQPPEHPQVLIEAEGGPTGMYSTSDATVVRETFRIFVLTGDRRLCYPQGAAYQGLFPIQWAILRAMMGWESPLRALTWSGKAGFVHHCDVSIRKMDIGNPRLPAQHQPAKTEGWNLVWQGEVEMWFRSADLV